jgi:DNA polymerase-3 subunit gamma/tau
MHPWSLPVDECKALYFKLVKQVHTDWAPAEEFSIRTVTMQQINSAYKRRDLLALKVLETKMPPPPRVPSPHTPTPESKQDTINASQDRTAARSKSPSSPSRPFREPDQAQPARTVNADYLSLENLIKWWPKVRTDSKAVDRKVEALLQQVNPAAIIGTTIVLVSPYEFHRKRVNDDDVRRVIEDVISALVHKRIQISCVTLEEAKALVDAAAKKNSSSNSRFP